MSQRNRNFLKSLWITGFKPSQSDYADIFDSFYNKVDEVIGTGGSASAYNLASPTNVTVGGMVSGTVLTGRGLDDILQEILIAYLNPAFSSFSSGLFTTYEVGQLLPSGSSIISYAVSNASNIKVQPPNIGVPSSNIPSATFPINPFNLLSSGTFSITIPSNTTSLTPAAMSVNCQGTNTKNVNFNTSGSILFRQRVFWGQNSNTSISESEIKALSNSQLRSGFAGTYTFPAGGYKYFCYPSSMGTATTFTDTSNGFPVAMFATVNIVSVTNTYGVTENYKIHRTTNILGGSITIAIS